MDEDTATLNIYFKQPLEVNQHIHFPGDPRHSEILHAIGEARNEIMATLQDTINTLSTDDAELAADVNALVSIINDIPARIQAAVASALTTAGVPDATIQASLQNVDDTVKTAIAAAKAALPVPPGTSTTSGADTSTNTVTGAAGTDTLTGGNGTDTAPNPGRADTTVGGSGLDTLGSASGTDTITTPAVPPPSSTGA